MGILLVTMAKQGKVACRMMACIKYSPRKLRKAVNSSRR